MTLSYLSALTVTTCGTLFFAVVGPLIGGLPFSLHPVIAAVIYSFAFFPAAVAGMLHSLFICLLLKPAIEFTYKRSGFASIFVFGFALGVICGFVAAFTFPKSNSYIHTFIASGISGGICGMFFAPWALKYLLSQKNLGESA